MKLKLIVRRVECVKPGEEYGGPCGNLRIFNQVPILDLRPTSSLFHNLSTLNLKSSDALSLYVASILVL